METLTGIYKIVNLKTKKFYIGSAKDIYKRYYEQHLIKLDKNIHDNIKLQRSYNKHGKENFILEIVEICNKDKLFEREQFYLDTIKPYENNIGYNIGKHALGGDNITNHPNLKEIKQKQSLITKERWKNKTKEEKKLYSSNLLGEKNPNWKNGASKAVCFDCGKEIYPYHERCSKCSKIGEKNPFYGKKHSKETIQKISISNKNKKHSEETKRKCKEASNLFYQSEKGIKFKKQLSEKIKGDKHFLFGIGHSEETKNKMRLKWEERKKQETIEDKFYKKCKLNYNILRFKEKYYLSYSLMSKDLNQDKTTLRFKCRHSSKKWSDYEEIKLTLDLKEEQKKFYIGELKKNNINFIYLE